MLEFIRAAWANTADVVTALADGVLGATLTLWAAFGAMPLPVALIAISAGLALGHALAQRADH